MTFTTLRNAGIALFLALLLASIALRCALAATEIGAVVTTYKNPWKPGAKSDQIIVERFDDPKVKNVSCYVSRAITGGYKALVGLAEDPSQYSIACRATGKIEVGAIDKSKSGESVFSESASALFKTVKVMRFLDADKNVLVYLVWSSFAVDGNPQNAVTAVPIE